MSVSMWSYRPEVCDGGGCPGDCDLCDKPKNMEDDVYYPQVDGITPSVIRQTDYISRQAVVEFLDSNNMPWRDWVNDIPSADVVEAVRCKDCKWHFNQRNLVGCNHDNMGDAVIGYPDDYCSFGERAEA